jgi:uroporphyrinogen decarboxylase
MKITEGFIMAELTGRERAALLFEHKKPDRIGLLEHFWGDTYKAWLEKGKIAEGTDFTRHFNFDISMAGWFNFAGNMDYQSEVVAEDEDTVTTKDQNYAILRRHKKHDTTPEHVGFTVDCREKWEELIKPNIFADERRMNREGYKWAKKYAADNNRYYNWSRMDNGYGGYVRGHACRHDGNFVREMREAGRHLVFRGHGL